MASQTKKPIDLAARVASRRSARASPATDGAWRRETFCLPRSEARAKAREWFDRYPKAAYMTEIEVVARTLRRPDRVRHAPIVIRRLRIVRRRARVSALRRRLCSPHGVASGCEIDRKAGKAEASAGRIFECGRRGAPGYSCLLSVRYRRRAHCPARFLFPVLKICATLLLIPKRPRARSEARRAWIAGRPLRSRAAQSLWRGVAAARLRTSLRARRPPRRDSERKAVREVTTKPSVRRGVRG